MNDLIKNAVSLGLGITIVTKEKLETYVKELVVKGEVAPEESKALVAKLIKKGEEQQDALKEIVRVQLQKLLVDLHLATEEDIKRLEQRIDQLEHKLQA
ncbi:polyhydroxyalkanoate synthesis regulator [Paenibacillus sp. CGMCC 1.16610]|uniref:Polyhydroxyalkanoate synthesis regulator n=1 Tax=Paenibacillus anseongense TaxID=2682845 RepID=A0ABW9UCD2_9BACL|nr:MULTISPECIES: polyhydroxyalkanoate synthesis regulator [Paenibacillus]MBA2937330.1 polyhydroxyalkanoate synthesis regulator [Paenibacillus sp. CGMCC 1.16610]MVQ36388.1 polyhydroxyalkanoate synthesis regulator [Paenibacillus anseongense]